MNPSIARQIRRSAGEVYREGAQWRISDDPDRVLRDVLMFALDEMGGDARRLLAALTPGGQEYASGDGLHGITWLEAPEDAPWPVEMLTAEDLTEHELWAVSVDGFDRLRPTIVVTGAALRELVGQFAEARGRVEAMEKA